jgi:hypothetical protein
MEHFSLTIEMRTPTGVLGSHWRVMLSEQPHSVVLADAEAAAKQAQKEQDQQLHEMKVSVAKEKGVYAPEKALREMGVAPIIKTPRPQDERGKTSSDTRQSMPPEAPARYPAISYFARLRELQSNGGGSSRGQQMRESRTTELKENAKMRIAQRFAHMTQQAARARDRDEDSSDEEEDHGRAKTDSLYGYDTQSDDVYYGDIPDDRPPRESVQEYQEREKREGQQRIADAQARYAEKLQSCIICSGTHMSTTRS